jgi:beta-glucanase (GH16 family)
MTTQGKYSTIYGKFEARIKLPIGQGMWPAFWMLGDDITSVGWPACGEIDIMEAVVGIDPLHNHGSLHAPSYDTTNLYYNATGFSNDFHIYSINW